MKLEDIGFYTLSDDRAFHADAYTPLWRCELILTDRCQFRCPYCRGVKPELRGDLSFDEAESIVEEWVGWELQNIRFSGGEPTIWPGLVDLVKYTKAGLVKHIAISTNGYNKTELYDELIDAGVNDFSVSLDACCSITGDSMAGNIPGAWERVIENIQHISKRTYVTVGVVLTDDNIEEMVETVYLASSLGVADIRLISVAQDNRHLQVNIKEEILDKHPILKYRINNFRNGVTVRGLSETDHPKCHLVLDDMAVVKGKHFPCIIYLREWGEAIGKVGEDMREERWKWFLEHNSYEDPICRKNCLDVCRDYSNRVRELRQL